MGNNQFTGPLYVLSSGQLFGRLTVIRKAEGPGNKYVCLCSCGETCSIPARRLQRSDRLATRSCGCAVKLHGGDKEHPEYSSWRNMRRRCLNPDARDYRHYGGRGIKICQRWLDSFVWFLVDMGPRPGPGYSIERIHNDGNYDPGNCCWATPHEQMRNMRFNRLITINGETLCVAEWAERSGLGTRTIFRRIQYSWPAEDLLSPPDHRRRHHPRQSKKVA